MSSMRGENGAQYGDADSAVLTTPSVNVQPHSFHDLTFGVGAQFIESVHAGESETLSGENNDFGADHLAESFIHEERVLEQLHRLQHGVVPRNAALAGSQRRFIPQEVSPAVSLSSSASSSASTMATSFGSNGGEAMLLDAEPPAAVVQDANVGASAVIGNDAGVGYSIQRMLLESQSEMPWSSTLAAVIGISYSSPPGSVFI